MRRAGRVDANQKEIVEALRMIPGCSVFITSSLGNGFPDLTVGYIDRNYLIELKDGAKPPSKRKLTEDEDIFHRGWNGQVDVAKNLDECLVIIGIGV